MTREKMALAVRGAVDLIVKLNTRVAELETECFKLAANQCHHGYGDEGGNHRCVYQDQREEWENHYHRCEKENTDLHRQISQLNKLLRIRNL